VRPAFFLVPLVLLSGCGSSEAPATRAHARAAEVTFKCEDMEGGRVIGAAIVRHGPTRNARYAEPHYWVSRADAKDLAHRLHARFTEDC
jgi:hypothetical protein